MSSMPPTSASSGKGLNPAAQSAMDQTTDNANTTMAMTKLMGELNMLTGLTTAVATTGEAIGSTAKNRGEALKGMV